MADYSHIWWISNWKQKLHLDFLKISPLKTTPWLWTNNTNWFFLLKGLGIIATIFRYFNKEVELNSGSQWDLMGRTIFWLDFMVEHVIKLVRIYNKLFIFLSQLYVGQAYHDVLYSKFFFIQILLVRQDTLHNKMSLLQQIFKQPNIIFITFF